MIQCIVCEDWLHGRHLVKGQEKLPNDENYSEMICFNCFEQHQSILKPYAGLSVIPVTSSDDAKNVSVDGNEEVAK